MTTKQRIILWKYTRNSLESTDTVVWTRCVLRIPLCMGARWKQQNTRWGAALGTSRFDGC